MRRLLLFDRAFELRPNAGLHRLLSGAEVHHRVAVLVGDEYIVERLGRGVDAAVHVVAGVVEVATGERLHHNLGDALGTFLVCRPQVPVAGMLDAVGVSPSASRPNRFVTDLEDRSHVFSPLLSRIIGRGLGLHRCRRMGLLRMLDT